MPQVQEFPTEDELNKLPRWALVAFAVFCAREAQQTMTRESKFWKAADAAARCAYFSAVLPPQTDDLEMQVAFEMAIEVTQDAARRSYRSRGKTMVSREEDALDVARGALHLSTLAKSDAKREMLVDTAVSIVAKLKKLAKAVDDETITCRPRDQYLTLAATAKKKRWNDDSKIPDEFF
jgi:hypothetical protein